MRAIGFCHLLLQSRALVSRSFSTRSLPHDRGSFFGSATATHPEVDVRAPSGFTPPEWLWWMSAFVFPNRSSNHCRACRASSMCQLVDLSAAAHTSKLRLERGATRSVKTTPFYDLARLPSKGTFLRPPSCDVCRTSPGVDPMSWACPAFVGFAANVPSHCAVSPLRYRVAFANAIASARPPYTPACHIDAGASLSQSQPFDFCNEIFKVRHTSTITASAVLARCRGWPCNRCHARCAFHAARLFLFWMQRRFELDAPQRATRWFPDTHPREASPEAPRGLTPTSDTVQVGPQDMGNAQAERAEQR